MRVIHYILSMLLNLIPKSERVFVFASFPDYTDNAYAMYRYMKGKYGDRCKYIWIFSDKESLKRYKDVQAYGKYSLLSFYYFARARNVFFTHGLYSFIRLRSKDKVVNLWHGMPLKVIGLMDTNHGGNDPTRADYLIATSPFFQELMSRSFKNIALDHVLVTGQPRNDLLFETTDFFTRRNINVKDYTSLGVWLPTYRSSIIGDIRNDGVFNEDGISFLSMDELARLDGFLQDRKALLIIKLHPMDALQEKEFGEFSNIIMVKPKEFDGQLYPLLGASDYLLTDYSSVWIDYCILKRPIGFVMNDIEEYRASRGLTIENLDEKLPGTIIDSYEKLTVFIAERPVFDDRYLSLYNSYCDNRAAERLARHLGI